MQGRPTGAWAWGGRGAHANHEGGEVCPQRTIGYRQPAILLLDLELVGEPTRVWVRRIVHWGVQSVLVGCAVTWVDLLWIGLGGIGHIWLPAAGAGFSRIPWISRLAQAFGGDVCVPDT